MATSWAARWKKQKPKTLLKDPLAEPLKELDTALEALEQRHSTKELSVIGGATRSARTAAQKTKEACNPKLHSETIRWLGHFDTELSHLYAATQTTQEEFTVFLTELQTKRDGMVKVLNLVPTDPSTDRIDKTIRLLEAFLTWFTQKAEAQIDNHEAAQVNKYVTAIKLLLGDLGKAVASGNPAEQQKKVLILAELKTSVEKLATPGGYPTMSSKRIDGVVNL